MDSYLHDCRLYAYKFHFSFPQGGNARNEKSTNIVYISLYKTRQMSIYLKSWGKYPKGVETWLILNQQLSHL